MKLEMDIRAVYHGIEFESGEEFFVARVVTEEGGESEVPVSRDMYVKAVHEYQKGVARQVADKVAVVPPPEKAQPPAEPVGGDGDEETVKVQKISRRKPAKKAAAAQADDDGFSPVDIGGE